MGVECAVHLLREFFFDTVGRSVFLRSGGLGLRFLGRGRTLAAGVGSMRFGLDCRFGLVGFVT